MKTIALLLATGAALAVAAPADAVYSERRTFTVDVTATHEVTWSVDRVTDPCAASEWGAGTQTTRFETTRPVRYTGLITYHRGWRKRKLPGLVLAPSTVGRFAATVDRDASWTRHPASTAADCTGCGRGESKECLPSEPDSSPAMECGVRPVPRAGFVLGAPASAGGDDLLAPLVTTLRLDVMASSVGLFENCAPDVDGSNASIRDTEFPALELDERAVRRILSLRRGRAAKLKTGSSAPPLGLGAYVEGAETTATVVVRRRR